MGVVPPQPDFLQGLRGITSSGGTLLIFDEVITGFRLTYGSSQQLFDVRPDMTVLGKIIGGGLPVAAYGGRREIMEQVAPLGPVYQAGTLSGNPLAMCAGLATLAKLDAPGFSFYPALMQKAVRLAEGLRAAAKRSSACPPSINSSASLLTLFFAESPVRDYADAKRSSTARFAAFHREMLRAGNHPATLAVRGLVRLLGSFP